MSLKDDDRKKAKHLYRRGVVLWHRFEETCDSADLDRAIENDEEALRLVLDQPFRVKFLASLASLFRTRFLNTQDLASVKSSIKYDQQTIALIDEDHPKRSKYLLRLGTNFYARFKKTNEVADINRATEYLQQALLIVSEDTDETRTEIFYRLGIIYRYRFRESGRLDELEKCISSHENAFQGLPRDSSRSKTCLGMLGDAYGDRFKKTNNVEDVNQSIRCYEQVLEAAPKQQQPNLTFLNNLALVLAVRFEASGQIRDINRSLEYTKKIHSLTPMSDSIGRAKQLGDIGIAFLLRFSRTSEMVDLEQSIQHQQWALEDLPPKSQEYINCLCNLGMALLERYRRTSFIPDLDQSLSCLHQVLDSTSMGDEGYISSLNNLAIAYGERFQRLQQMTDLDKTVDYHQQALKITNINHLDRAMQLSRVGLRLRLRYIETGEVTDLDQSIEFGYKAVSSTPVGHPERLEFLATLAIGLAERFAAYNNIDDINKAIKLSCEAIEAFPEDHPQRARHLFCLGHELEVRARKTGSYEDLDNSTKRFMQAALSETCFPLVRIAAAMFAVDNLVIEEEWGIAADMLAAALLILGEVVLPTNFRDDMQYLLKLLSKLASLTVSVFLKAGKSPLEALQGLEKARGIIASFSIDARSDLSILERQQPELFSRYMDCQNEITRLEADFNHSSQLGPRQDYLATNAQRTHLYKLLEELRDEIRQCAGFDHFLLSLSETEIQGLAWDGPIVCFNVSEVSSEAIIIMTEGIHALPLPNLQVDRFQRQIRTLASRGNPTRRDATLYEEEDDMPAIAPDLTTELKYIWDAAVKPVLQHTKLLKPFKPLKSLPRIWWVGGGVMSLLPLQAAGNHSPGSSENTFSHAVSSYAPTVRALKFVKYRPPPIIYPNIPKILIVSMSATAGHYQPLNVLDEVESIKMLSKSVSSVIHLDRPSRAAVLEALKSCTIAHFACHGTADLTDPAKSALVVGEGDSQEKITVEDLDKVKADHKQAQIVYLSACSTAEIRVSSLLHESIHLASALQLSGFQNVIGTLWGADDKAAVKIAGEFYRILLQKDHGFGGSGSRAEKKRGGGLQAARALHEAVLNFRNEGDNWQNVSEWAPFIHMGS